MEQFLLQLLYAFFGSLGFALLFGVGKKNLFLSSLGGILVWGIYLFVFHLFSGGVLLSSLFAAAAGQLYAEILARIRKSPTTVFFIPAIIPLIPGGSLYRCMDAAVGKDWALFRRFGSETFLTALGIAIGISFVSGLLIVFRKAKLAH